ncbi:MAG: hypothetical protein JWO44_605 [Bacteroidetes bacterium]|nr:hypothetical protein [Bacteroidota bacterium]
MIKKSRLLFIKTIALSVILLLSGCQANLQWFLRNLTQKAVVLTLHYETKQEKYRRSYLPLREKYVSFKKEIMKIDYSTEAILDDSLPVTMTDSSTYQLVIPARSTVELTYIIPTDYGYHSNVVAILQQEGTMYSVNTSSAFDKHSPFHMAGGLTLKNLVYYDYGTTEKDSQ